MNLAPKTRHASLISLDACVCGHSASSKTPTNRHASEKHHKSDLHRSQIRIKRKTHRLRSLISLSLVYREGSAPGDPGGYEVLSTNSSSRKRTVPGFDSSIPPSKILCLPMYRGGCSATFWTKGLAHGRNKSHWSHHTNNTVLITKTTVTVPHRSESLEKSLITREYNRMLPQSLTALR